MEDTSQDNLIRDSIMQVVDVFSYSFLLVTKPVIYVIESHINFARNILSVMQKTK